MVAIDATARPRPDGRTFEETVEALRGETLIMADCSCMDDVQRALDKLMRLSKGERSD